MCFFAAKLKSTILCALLDHLSKQNWGFLMNFLKKRDLSEFSFEVGENSPPPKKIAGEISEKIKTTFLGHEFFLLFKLKLQSFFQESAAKFTIFYLLADLAVRYTLCGRYTLCAHCKGSRGFSPHITFPRFLHPTSWWIY